MCNINITYVIYEQVPSADATDMLNGMGAPGGMDSLNMSAAELTSGLNAAAAAASNSMAVS